MKKRLVIKLLAISALAMQLPAYAAAPVVDVYKSANCGCCSEWASHLEKNGFTVKVRNVGNPTDYREKFGIPDELGSCHTGNVNGYALEGHVPAADIRRVLAEKPKARGLAVPAMPMGSPGMEGPHRHPYDVMLVGENGRYAVYRHYDAR